MPLPAPYVHSWGCLRWAAMSVLLGSTPALADGAAILRCRQVAEPAQRMACYEAIAVPLAHTAPAMPTPSALPAPTGADGFGLEAMNS